MEISTYKQLYGKNTNSVSTEILAEIKGFLSSLEKVQNPMVSINIPTYNCCNTILSHLYSLSETKTLFPFELIFIDNNSTDGTYELLMSLGVNVIKEKNQGVGFARQTGIQTSKGEVILFGDPDTLYPPNWVNELTIPFYIDKEIVINYSTSESYIKNYRIPLKITFRNIAKRIGVYILAKTKLKPHYLLIRGHNMAVRRKTALEINGFHPNVMFPTDGIYCLQYYVKGKILYSRMKQYPLTELPIK